MRTALARFGNFRSLLIFGNTPPVSMHSHVIPAFPRNQNKMQPINVHIPFIRSGRHLSFSSFSLLWE
jgi:hypothetical protein